MHYMDINEAYGCLDGIRGPRDAFPDQHLLQLGIRLGYLTVVSRVPCARVVCCAARLMGEDSSTIDSFLIQ